MSLEVDEKTRQRLLKYVVMPEDEKSCWQWTGGMSGTNPKWLPYKSGLSCNAAKAVYQLFKGEVPEGKKLTRVCGNPRCVSPHHVLTDFERFWSKVDKTSHPKGCWLWLDHIKPTGYGEYRDGKKKVVAHRFAYELIFGPIPEGLVVMHVCDTRACTNPTHLKLGTQADNIHDMINKGRSNFIPPPPKRGEESKAAKLTESKVSDIKKLISEGISDCEIARRYKVGRETIRNIRKGWTWKHVE